MAIKPLKIVRVIVISLLGIATSILLFLMINNFQFRKGITVHVIYNHVGALDIGSWVRKSGLKVGSVTKMQIDPKDGKSVIVTITFKPGEIPRQDDRFAIVVSGIMGDQYIEDFPGPLDSPPVPEGYTYKGEPMFDVSSLATEGAALLDKIEKSIDILSDILINSRGSIDRTIRNIEVISEDLKETTLQIKKISAIIPDLTKTIKLTTEKLNNLTQKIEKETVKFIDSNSKDISQSVENIKISTDKLKDAIDQLTQEGSILDVINRKELTSQIPEMIENLNKTSENIMKLTEELQQTFSNLGE